MDTELLDHLKQRHAYESWRDRNTLGENLFVWQFFLSGNELPDWQAHRIQRIDAAGWPPSIQSIWRRAESRTEMLLRVDVYECSSRSAAHAFLVRLLGEFQSALIARQPEAIAGDVAFADPTSTSAGILFARANLVVLIQNAGRDLVSVDGIARRFDGDLISHPETEGGKVVPEIRRFEASGAEAPVEGAVRLELEAADPLERPLWYKFFSSSGEVFLAQGRLSYRAGPAGSHEVTAYAINADGGAARRRLQVDVR